MESMTWDYILKYVIIGDAAVGKSSILLRLTDDRFATTEPTLGVEFGSRILTIGDEGKRVKVQCWDTAGTESFRSITRSYFRGAAGALLVYDVTRRDTFEHVTSWLKDLREHADENVSIILVGNKTDLCSASPPEPSSSLPPSSSPLPSPSTPSPLPSPSPAPSASAAAPTPTPNGIPGQPSEGGLRPRAVSTKEGQQYAKQHGLLYVETSAKEGWGVEAAFEWTAREVLANVSRSELEQRNQMRKGVRLKGDLKRRAGCC